MDKTMPNENTGENQTNQETDEQKIERLRAERDEANKKVKTMEAQKSHWKKKAEEKSTKPSQPEKEKKGEKVEEKSNEPDYAKLAFLEGKGIKHPDDQKRVLDEADRLKLPLTDVLEMKHLKSELKDAQDQREAGDGMPKGKGKSGNVKHDVDYHLAKDTRSGDLELDNKIIEAKINKEKSANKFSDELYTG